MPSKQAKSFKIYIRPGPRELKDIIEELADEQVRKATSDFTTAQPKVKKISRFRTSNL